MNTCCLPCRLRAARGPYLPKRRVLVKQWARILLLAATLGAAAAPAQTAVLENFGDKFLMLGTGPVGGAFRPIGESVCDAINQDREVSLVRCVPVGTAGSTFNLHAVANGAIQLGVAQEDLVAQLYTDRKQARGKSLRVIALLHDSPIAVMVHKASGITDLRQIGTKHVNLGNRGSGQFTITAALLRALDLRKEDLAGASYLATSEFEEAFCGRKVDVVVEAVAHPSVLFEKLIACGGVFIDIPEPVRLRLRADNKLLSAMVIPAGTYLQQDQPVTTLGMRNVLFTSAAVDEEAIFRLTTTLRQRQGELQASQPLLGNMLRVGPVDGPPLPAPVHPGVTRALKTANDMVRR